MTRASTSRTAAKTAPSDEFLRLTRNPKLISPTRFERQPKVPGSFEFVDGKLVEVK